MAQFPISIDVVGIFDNAFNQLFQNARPLRAQLREANRIMDHPRENGQTNSDYKITLPVEIVMPLVLVDPYVQDVYDEIKTASLNSTSLTVQTRTGIYSNMVIQETPHDETTELYNGITIYLRLREIQIPLGTQNFSPADPTQANTLQEGEQNPSTFPNPSAATQQQINAAFLAGGG